MNCRAVRKRLLEPGGGARPEVAAHVAGCPACTAEARVLSRLEAASREVGLPVPAPSPDLVDRVMSRIEPGAGPGRRGGRTAPRVLWAFAAAGTLVVVTGTYLAGPPGPPRERTEEVPPTPAVPAGSPTEPAGPGPQTVAPPGIQSRLLAYGTTLKLWGPLDAQANLNPRSAWLNARPDYCQDANEGDLRYGEGGEVLDVPGANPPETGIVACGEGPLDAVVPAGQALQANAPVLLNQNYLIRSPSQRGWFRAKVVRHVPGTCAESQYERIEPAEPEAAAPQRQQAK